MKTISQRPSFEISQMSSTGSSNSSEQEAQEVTWSTSGVPSGRWPMGDDQLLVVYVLPIVIFAGTIGNGLSMAVLSRPRMRYSSVYFYLLVLACADTLVLYVSAFKTWIRLVTSYELLHFSNAACKVLMFVLLVSMTLSAWLVVFVTADRFVAVRFPFRAASLCNISRARVATVALLGATVVLHCHVFWSFSLFRVSGGGGGGGEATKSSRLICGPDEAMFKSFEYVKMTTYCVIPFVVILCLNIAIIDRLRSSARGTIQMADSSSGGRPPPSPPPQTRMRTGSHHPSILRHMRDPYSQTRVTSMLLAVSFAWLLLTSPFTIYGIIASITNRWYLMVKAVCFILMYTNHAINFLLYCLTGKKFRRQLVELCVRFARRRRRRSVPNASPSVRTQRASNVVELDQSLMNAEKQFHEFHAMKARTTSRTKL